MRLPISLPDLDLPVRTYVSETLSKSVRLSKGWLTDLWIWIKARRLVRSRTRRLRVIETVSLGEKRFVAVIHVDGRQFLLGGGAANVALLAQLGTDGTFDATLAETMTVLKKKATTRTRKPNAKSKVKQNGEQA